MKTDNSISEIDMNSLQKTPEQQIDEAVKISKALFLPKARNSHETKNTKTEYRIRRRSFEIFCSNR